MQGGTDKVVRCLRRHSPQCDIRDSPSPAHANQRRPALQHVHAPFDLLTAHALCLTTAISRARSCDAGKSGLGVAGYGDESACGDLGASCANSPKKFQARAERPSSWIKHSRSCTRRRGHAAHSSAVTSRARTTSCKCVKCSAPPSNNRGALTSSSHHQNLWRSASGAQQGSNRVASP